MTPHHHSAYEKNYRQIMLLRDNHYPLMIYWRQAAYLLTLTTCKKHDSRISCVQPTGNVNLTFPVGCTHDKRLSCFLHTVNVLWQSFHWVTILWNQAHEYLCCHQSTTYSGRYNGQTR